MKIHEMHFEHYLSANTETSLHPALTEMYQKFPEKITDLKNLLFYKRVFIFQSHNKTCT